MSKFLEWLLNLFRRQPVPQPQPPPVDPPIPRPAPPGPPGIQPPPTELARRAMVTLNARRAERGVGPLAHDDGLMVAAMELALPLGLGRAQPHEDFPGRVRRHGWPYEDLGVKSGFGNTSEGISWGGRTPEEAVLILDSSPDPREGHRRDFEDRLYNFVGIAIVINGSPSSLPAQQATGPPEVPRTLASVAVCGPAGDAVVAPWVMDASAPMALGGGFTDFGGLCCVVCYGSRKA
jgi:uncharacterized protein YkwD